MAGSPARRAGKPGSHAGRNAVVTTGICCRPGCGAHPLAQNVRAFAVAAISNTVDAGYEGHLLVAGDINDAGVITGTARSAETGDVVAFVAKPVRR
jgi:hypothetical protein